MANTSDQLPQVDRATVYTPQAGDVVVLEVDGRSVTNEHAARLKEHARAAFGHDVKVVVLSGARFAGVVRASA